MHIKIFIVIIVLFSSSHLAIGQFDFKYKIDSIENLLEKTTNDTIRIPILDQLIPFYFMTNENKRIYELLEEYEDLSFSQNNHLGIIKVYVYYGSIYFQRERNFERGLEFNKKALNHALKNKLEGDIMYASLYNQVGLVHKNMDLYDSAIFYYQKSLEYSDKTDNISSMVTARINLSRLNSAIGNKYESIKLSKEILQLGLDNQNKIAIYYGYRRLGEAYREIGAYSLAKEYLERALELSIELYGGDDTDTYYTYNLLGRVNSNLGEFEKALSYHHKYLNDLKRHYGEVHPTQTGAYTNIGKLFAKLGVYDSAEHYLDLGLASLDKKQQKFDFAAMDILKAKADLFLKMKDKKRLLEIIQQAFDYKLRDERRKGGVYKLKGDYYSQEGDLEKAIETYQKSLQAYVNGFNSNNQNDNPQMDDIGTDLSVFKVLLSKGQGFEKLAQKDKQLRKEFLQQAKNTYLLCDSVIFNSEWLYQTDDDAISFFNSWKQVYAHGIQVSKQLYEMEDDPKYMDLAFHFAERSKATVISRASSQRNILSNFGVGDSIRSYQERLKSNIAHYQTKLNTARLKADTLQVRKHSNRLFALQNEQAILNDSLRLNYPDYYELLNKSDNTLSRSEIAAKLGKRVLIEYTVGEDSIYAFVMDRQKTRLISLKKDDDLDYLIDEYSVSILKKQTQEFSENAHLLYNRLMEPLLRDVEPDRELLIIPDAQLWRVNFDLLLTENNTSKDFGVLPYLIKRYPISYANSASFLFHQVKQITPKGMDQCLAFSYSEEEQNAESSKIDFIVLRDATGDLPGTREEIRSISSILSGAYYYGEEASEANFKSNVGKYGVLHLALHGELNDQDPLYSNLRFSPSETDTLEDNLLYTYEIYDMRFDAYLAVLSACNTAQGELRGGEGVMSLGRAFQYAGVQSLLVSNWEVADKQAPRLMQYFYEGLINEGYSKSVALQKAKLKYLETASIFEKAPFYWGNFMVLGNPSPIISKTDHSVWLGFLVVLLTFGVMFWVLEIRRKAAG